MKRSKADEACYNTIAVELGVPVAEVQRAVESYFNSIARESRKLPFDNVRKIYTKEMFEGLATVRNIPFIGRIGPVYSRYLTWRKNESSGTVQKPRSSYRVRITQDDLENMADDILSGRAPTPLNKKRNSDLFDRVWLVGPDGKRQARQVIPKTKEDGIQD